MPAVYAHYRFGNDILQLLPAHKKDELCAHRSLYDIGVHGPDLLFYYKPYLRNDVSRIGFENHEETGRVFFERAAKALKEAADFPAALAYAKGLLTHFALDSVCHPFIEEKTKTGTAAHTEIESSFDRLLLLKDGDSPTSKKLCSHIVPSAESAAVIAGFFPPVTAGQILRAEKSIIFYNDLLIAPHWPKRLFNLGVLKLSGHYEELRGLMIPRKQNQRCADSDVLLYGLYQQALSLAQKLFCEFDDYLGGYWEFSGAFDHTFGADAAPGQENGEMQIDPMGKIIGTA